MYKKEYEQVLKSKDENWRKKHNYKHLKIFGHQADKSDKIKKEKDKTKNELNDRLLSLKDSKFRTSRDKYRYDFSNMTQLIKDIANNKITKDDAINTLKKDVDNTFEIK